MSDRNSAVGVFDSGLGGLTSVKELKKILPHENIIYFGDTGRVPYGMRSPQTITEYAKQDLKFLSSFDIKAALVACGTVSSIALEQLKKEFSLPIIGAVNPACVRACSITKNNRIAVLATSATIKTGAFEREIKRINPDCEVFSKACPMLVPLIENGYIDKNCTVTNMMVQEYLSPFSGTDIDTIILGCTHYPIIKDIVAKVACSLNISCNIIVVDSGYEAACEMKNLLCKGGLENASSSCGRARYFVSDEPCDFQKVASIFLGEEISEVQKVTVDQGKII